LIISFARSGKSPESCAVLELADKLCKNCFHLIITCNAEGSLARYASPNPACVFVLPPEANDKSLAMTGSYSGMLLTALLLAYSADGEFCRRQLGLLTRLAEKILVQDIEMIREIAGKEFRRTVFLGSGPLFGTATEAALKLQELTDGQIICKAESYLGFRHGPKAVIDESTLVVYFFSNDEYVRQYETDMLSAMRTGNRALFHLAVGERVITHSVIEGRIELAIAGNGVKDDGPGGNGTAGTAVAGTGVTGTATAGTGVAEDWLTVCSILPGQLLGFYKSLQLGLMPDSPSVTGAISRIVEGVTIYPVEI
jgi:tagatose-6-phosphate ketose/aldose isomerase